MTENTSYFSFDTQPLAKALLETHASKFELLQRGATDANKFEIQKLHDALRVLAETGVIRPVELKDGAKFLAGITRKEKASAVEHRQREGEPLEWGALEKLRDALGQHDVELDITKGYKTIPIFAEFANEKADAALAIQGDLNAILKKIGIATLRSDHKREQE